MKISRLPLSVLLAPALLALAPPLAEDGLHFAPAKDSTLSKTFTTSFDMGLDDLSINVDGQDIGQMMGDIDMTMSSSTTIGITDTYLDVADGRPVKLRRTFDQLGSDTTVDVSSGAGSDSKDITGASELEGRTVLYSWNPDEEKYDVSYDGDEDGDADILDGLVEDLDMRTFLPPGDVSVDDSWNVSLKDLGRLAVQSNSLRILPEDMDPEALDLAEQFMGGDFQDKLLDLLDGECKCTLKSVHEEDDQKLGDIAVEIHVTSSADLSQILHDVIAKAAESQGEDVPEFDFDAADLDLDVDGEGTLVWNMTAGHIESMTMSADITAGFDISASVDDDDGQSHTFSATIEVSGSMNSGVETE